MLRASGLRFACLLAILIVSRPTPATAAWPHNPYLGNVPVCTIAGNQIYPQSASDGAGGVIVTWYDQASNDIFAQRISAAGVPLWTTNGVVVCNAAGAQIYPTIVSDGAGGAIIAWDDQRSGNYDVYAQRLNGAGVPQWAANGIVICDATLDQNIGKPLGFGGTIVTDGGGGAVIAWNDQRSGLNSHDVYAQRVNAAGVVQWTANGVAVSAQPSYQIVQGIVQDAVGGFLLVWYDNRSGTSRDIYAQRLNSAGVPQWAADGQLVCNAANDQDTSLILADGSGGAIVTWRDYRVISNIDLYVQRMTAAGGAAWTLNGVPLCLASGEQDQTGIISDGVGGAIIVWWDYRSGTADIYAQRILGGLAQWQADGVPICTATGNQQYPAMMADGAGGAIIAWEDGRSMGEYNVYAQRVSSAGYTHWAFDGVPVATSPFNQGGVVMTPDGTGGAILTFHDFRVGAAGDIYAQRIERFGYLGNPEPSIASVRDVPLDQGGKIKVAWNASYLDADPFPVYSYWIWRSVPPNVAAAALASGALRADPMSRIAPARGQRLFRQDALSGYAWEYVGSQPARGFSSYSYVLSTLGDSVGAGNPHTAIMIEALGNSGAFWDSAPDSGYSVDNLAPAQPAPFTGQYFAGATHLHWGRNSEADLVGYRLYKGSSPSFVPGPGNLVSAQPDTGYADSGPAGSWYKLSAVDVHSNESPFAVLSPGGTTAVQDGAPSVLALALASPNPSRAGARFRLSLPRSVEVRLVVHDVAGREVLLLARGTREAGVHEIAWDGRTTAGGIAPNGMYVARLVAGGEVRAQRFMMLR